MCSPAVCWRSQHAWLTRNRHCAGGADGAGQVKVSYYAPAALAARHQLSASLAAKLAGIDPLTDALIAP